MNSATKVAEIFTAAGEAFSRLGDIIMQLHQESPVGGKWTDEEIQMINGPILRFLDDINKISSTIKNRIVTQKRQALKRKALEDAGVPAKQLPVQQEQHVVEAAAQIPQTTTAEVTMQIQAIPQPPQQQVTQETTQQIVKQQIVLQPPLQQQQPTLIAAGAVNTQPQLVHLQQKQSPQQQSHQPHQTQPQTVHIQNVQHIVPLTQILQQQTHQQPSTTATTTSPQIIQTKTKQIIIQASPHSSTSQISGGSTGIVTLNNVTAAGNILTSSSPQISQPQIVHLLPQQLQQLQQAQKQHQQQQQHILQPTHTTTTTTTVTLQQFQQMQAQKQALLAAQQAAAAAAVAVASSTSTSASNVITNAVTTTPTVNTNTKSALQQTTITTASSPATVTVTENIVLQHSNSPTAHTIISSSGAVQNQSSVVPPVTASLVAAKNESTLPATSTVNNNLILPNAKTHVLAKQISPLTIHTHVTTGTTLSPSVVVATTNPVASVALKSGPDVSMTLNRINTAENEVDVEECLPADIVKLDFAGEEVAG